MHLEVFVGEPSAKEALDRILPRILGLEHTYEVHPFRDKQEALREIPKRLRAYARWIPEDWRVVVLVDEDREDCKALKRRLVQGAVAAGLADRVLAGLPWKSWRRGSSGMWRRSGRSTPGSPRPCTRRLRTAIRTPSGAARGRRSTDCCEGTGTGRVSSRQRLQDESPSTWFLSETARTASRCSAAV